MMQEIWLPVEGYPQYFVSTFGRVASTKNRTGQKKLLSQWPDKDGYLKTRLCQNNKPKNVLVHRLVATVFAPNPKGLTVVNHIDENKANNRADNLEWCTVQYNTVYNGSAIRRAETLRKPIAQYTLDGKLVKVWRSRAEIQAETGCSGGNITLVCQGKRHKAYGFIWKYAMEEWGRS